MGGHVVGVIANVLCILDHEAGVVGDLEPLHTSDQLSPGEEGEWRSWFSQHTGEAGPQGKGVFVRLTYDFPENMGPRMSCSERQHGILIDTHQHTTACFVRHNTVQWESGT